ncbi:tetratricopeptide repeat protein [Halieaceae bacterium IMCC14734]|uniref:Ancillary SecYEG translocon subunit n=1 Tax=Candidatus Litorirhabdus singularis TaxID=2518993 RepID=A0ABT3TIX1_9GAMM|nr:tetratricopeptide repeat protein [Candidatus Litorirhabdus singularis]MCX2981740.1 tetratricopeptide repeat protein [Candidatus Litorirhabdus singularis]
MAEEFRTEEEQVEALKKWWQDNGKSTIAVIVLALAGSLGWQSWQQRTGEQAEAASTVYQSMLDAINVSGGNVASAEQEVTVRHLAGTLKTDFSGTTYAHFAALHLAKLAVSEEDLVTAEAELRWVLNSGPDTDMQRVVQLRLARVVAAAGDPDSALSMLRGENVGTYSAAYAEAEGDIQQQLGNLDAAVEAYRRAAALQLDSGATAPILELKLQAIAQLREPQATIPELVTSED